MSAYILDYDVKKKVGIVKSTNLDLIREHFSVEDPGAKFVRTARKFFIPTRKFAITPTGRFETGLATDIYKKILQIDPTSSVQITSLLKDQISFGKNVSTADIVKPSHLALRDYQEQVVQTCMLRGRGIAIVATAGGKTLIMSTLISTLRKEISKNKIVVITPTQLTKQTYDEFNSYNNDWKCTWWTGEHDPDTSSEVIVAGSKILLSEKQDITWLFDADALIIDEVHTLRYGNSINKIIKKFPTKYRIGFTGTLPENILDQWCIKGLIGPVIYEKTSHDLRQQQYISQAVIQVIQINYKQLPDYSDRTKITAQYTSELDFIIHNTYRNEIIKKISHKCNNNVLILVDRLEHGDILYHTLKALEDKLIYFIKGDVEQQEREKIKQLMEQSSNVICIAISAIFSTGINIKNLHYIIFAAGGKAKIRIIQSIGRGLRLHENKKQLVVFDMFDNLKYGEKHWLKRKILYEKEKINYNIKQVHQ